MIDLTKYAHGWPEGIPPRHRSLGGIPCLHCGEPADEIFDAAPCWKRLADALEAVTAERDEARADVRKMQERVRGTLCDVVGEALGRPVDGDIDGSGSDGDEFDFTACEVAMGCNLLIDERDEAPDEVARLLEEQRKDLLDVDRFRAMARRHEDERDEARAKAKGARNAARKAYADAGKLVVERDDLLARMRAHTATEDACGGCHCDICEFVREP